MAETTTPALAGRLLAAGIPVVTCKPNPNWTPGSTQPDVIPPKGWATITAETAANNIHKHRPGIDTLAMVGGHGIDILDIDTKMPGVSFTDLPAEVRAYGVTLSPSGGAHFPVPSTGYGKGALNVAGKHVGDYIGGTANGGGRMLAFLPGSSRPKYAGTDYREVKPWDIPRILDDTPPDIVTDICAASGNLSKTATEGRHAATGHEIGAFLHAHADSVECAHGAATITAATNAAPTTKRHEWYIAAITRAVELIKAGCLDAGAIDTLTARLHTIKPEGGTSPTGCLAWAISNTNPATECPTHDPALTWLNEAAEHATNKERSTEDEVFTATPELAYLRDLARARMVNPWALLAACATRVIAATGPAWTVPAFVGTNASLNFYTALIGSSNSGKTITSAVAAEALPNTTVDVLNPSSGEGLVAMYVTTDKGKQIIDRDRVLSIIDEIATLGGQQGRSGSTLGSVLRTAWSGAEISNHAADPTRRRHIGAHTYRFAMICGVQYATAHILMADEGAGTPQRFLWIPAADPHATLDHPEPDGDNPFTHWTPPRFVTADTTISYPPGVREHVRATRLAAVRNTNSDRDALHGHMLLVRLKLAAGLAILHNTTTVTNEMWAVSGHITDLSTQTLDIVLNHAKKEAATAATAKGHAAAAADEIRDERRIVQAARIIGAHVQRHHKAEGDELTRSRLNRAAGRNRPILDEAITKSVALGYINDNNRENRKKPGETVTFYTPGNVRA